MVWLSANVEGDPGALRLMKGRGCPRCNGTGYKGRTGIYELLEIDEAMADALRRDDTADYIAAANRSEDFRPLALCALDLAADGVTSLDEVLRVAGDQDLDSDSVANPTETQPA